MSEFSCHLHADCFTCPYPDCMISSTQSVTLSTQRQVAKELYMAGNSVPEISIKMNKHKRSIQRYLAYD